MIEQRDRDASDMSLRTHGDAAYGRTSVYRAIDDAPDEAERRFFTGRLGEARSPGGRLARVHERLFVVEAMVDGRFRFVALCDRPHHGPGNAADVDDENPEPRAVGADVLH